MTKITPKQKELMITLRNDGVRIIDIATTMGLTPNLIQYHTDEEQRKKSIRRAKESFKKLTYEQKREVYKKRYPKIKEWISTNYHTNEEFRQRHIRHVRAWQEKQKNKRKDYE